MASEPMPLTGGKQILTNENVGDSEAARSFGGVEATLPQDLQPGLVMAIVAPPNTGKTTLTGTLRESKHGLGTPAVLVDSKANAHVLGRGDDIFVVKSRTGFSTAQSIVESFKAGRDPDIKSLVFDHVTNMYNEEVSLGNAKDSRQNYSAAMAALLRLTRDSVDLAEGPRRMNVFFYFQEAQEQRVIFEDGAVAIVTRQEISLSDKMQTSWPNLVPLMAGLRIGMWAEPFPRVLDFTPSKNTMTKWQVKADERLYRLPIVVWNPSLGRILDVLQTDDPIPPEWNERPKLKL